MYPEDKVNQLMSWPYNKKKSVAKQEYHPEWEFVGNLWSDRNGKFLLEKDGKTFELKLKNPEFKNV